MNKIYKVVWNTVRNCYVVGSELISSKSGRHSTSNSKSSSLKVTLTVLALCGMTALGSGVAPAYAANAGTAVESQYVAVLVNSSNNSRSDYRDFDGYSYHKERIASTGDVYWVRDGYTIKYEADKRYPGARNANIIKAYKTSSYTADNDAGLLKSNQIMVESAGISTLTGVDLDDVSGGTYVGATNSGSTSTPSSFNYMIKDDNGTYVDAGNTKFSKRFKAATKNKDGTYSYKGEVIANDNLYVVDEQVGVFLTSSGKVYTGKVFGANNEVLMTTKSDEGTMYSYWGADTPDPNTKLADMTIGQFNQALEKVNNNSKAVAGDTIKEIKTTAKTDGGTIDLVRRGQYNSATGQYEGEHKVGSGITITSRGGTNGKDVKINFSNGTTGFDVAAGSKVSAIGTPGATTGLTINGVDYTIKTGDFWTAQAGGKDVKAVDQKVNFNSTDKHLVVESTQDGEITFATKGLADTSFTNITEEGNTYIKNLAKGEDRHIEAKDYAVDENGTVTMTYIDGNGNTVDGTAKITGIAKSDLTNITEGGKTVINNLAKEAVKVVSGMNTTVESSTTTDGPVEYKVNLNEDVNLGDTIYLNGSDGSISAKSGGAQLAFNTSGLTVSQAKNGLTNETRINGAEITVDGGIGNQTTIKGSTARIGSVLVNGGSGTATISGLTNQTTKYDGFANGSGRAATEEQLKEVDSKAAAAKTTVTNGKNITVDEAKAANGSSAYTVGLETDVVLGDNAIKLNGSDGSISAKSGGAQLAFNNSGLTVSQVKNGLTNETRIDGATITVDGGAGNQTIINGSTAHIGSVLVNGGGGTATITGLTNKTTDYTGFATAGRAATEEQLKEVAGQAGEAIETAGKGWNLTTNGKESSKTNIKPGGTVDFSSSNDNLLISNAGADLSFSLSDNLDLTKNDSKKGSVKVGENTTLTDGLLRVGTDVSLTASALNVGNSSLTTSALMVGGLTYIDSNGLNANNRVISNVAAGILDTDAVNVGQLKSAISGSQVSIKAGDGISVAKTGNQYTINVNIEGVTNNQGKVTVSTGDSTSTESGSESGSSGAKKSQVMDLMYRTESNEVAPETTTDTGKAIQIESIPEDIKLEADDNQAASVVNGETIKIAGDGTNISTKANVTGAGSMDTISVSLKPDIHVNSVTINNGGPTINNTGIDMNGKSITNVENITVNNGPTINSSGIDMNSQNITNLKDGKIAEGSTDAVNGGQIYNLKKDVSDNINILNEAVVANAENINSLSHLLNKLDSRINRVGAGAAALAALHPLDFDPDNKWDFAAGYGNYAGANAVAIGTYYRPNENTMFSIGGSFGGGENMINAGVSFKLGSGGSGITTSKTVMAKKIKEQDELLKAQDAKMKEQDEKIAKLEALVAQQGEMIQQALGKK